MTNYDSCTVKFLKSKTLMTAKEEERKTADQYIDQSTGWDIINSTIWSLYYDGIPDNMHIDLLPSVR